ncbi:MAG TPA: potassium-transporting ATPase subunit C, partial [Acidimicrobiales bacterium]|nr:potassium-transporting ATPase subunit C [Acidimicrobiales bacterium]
MRRQLVTGLVVTVVLTVLLGGAYPLAVWAVGRVAFGHKTDGSFVKANGKVVGSALIGQNFTDRDGNPLRR